MIGLDFRISLWVGSRREPPKGYTEINGQRVRLSDRILKGLIEVFGNLKGCEKVEIYLFGSRTRQRAKGGDIDLLVVVPQNWTSSQRFRFKLNLLKKIYKRLGERKVDIVIVSPDSDLYREFIKGSVKLWSC